MVQLIRVQNTRTITEESITKGAKPTSHGLVCGIMPISCLEDLILTPKYFLPGGLDTNSKIPVQMAVLQNLKLQSLGATYSATQTS